MDENVINVVGGKTWWWILFSQFKSSLVVVLLLAMGMTFILGDYRDGVFILAAMIINALIGFFQEERAEKRLNSLKLLVAERALIKKDGKWSEVNARTLQVGDVVKLSIGQKVPADGTITLADRLLINEAIISGESVPMAKSVDGDSKGWMGCVVENRIGEMKVEKIGKETKLGMIAKVSNDVEDVSPLKTKLSMFSKYLSLAIWLVLVIFLIVGISRGQTLKELMPLVAALMVAAIPEGMVICLTVILSMGMRRLLDKKAIVKSLTAAETLGGVTTICLDKTGTITLGKMTAIKAEALNKKDEEELYREALLCNDYRDPLEYAMADLAVLKLGKNSRLEVEKKYPRIDEEPFDPKKKIIVTIHKTSGNKKLWIMSGAPEVVLDKCKGESVKEKVEWETKIREAGDGGYRMVAFASKTSGEYRFVGLILFVDQIREGVATSLRGAVEKGISLKVVTGDYKETAWVAMQGVGLIDKGVSLSNDLVVTGEELQENKEGIKEKICRAKLFARMTPEQKLEIVETLQKMGEVVAMMGDGVNDAPALKKSDIGITVYESSDVARESADLVLLDNNFKTIIEAVKMGRAMTINIKRSLVFLLSGTFSTLFLIMGSVWMGIKFPLSTTYILIINFVVETIPSVLVSLWPGRVDPGIIRFPTKGEIVKITGGAIVVLLGFLIGIMGLAIYIMSSSVPMLITWLIFVPTLILICLQSGLVDNVIK